jgi:hypothetical protein
MQKDQLESTGTYFQKNYFLFNSLNKLDFLFAKITNVMSVNDIREQISVLAKQFN